MDISGKTRIYGIFGYPVGHSLSPLLHNAVFRKKKIDAVYLPFEIRPDYLSEAIEAMRALGLAGVNVTIPHKEGAANYVDEVPQDIDRAIGAVNTIVAREGKLIGFNTDGPGFIEDLRDRFDFFAKGKAVLMVGAGGAARAVAFSLVREQCAQLLIYNRTPERAKGLAQYLGTFFPGRSIRAVLSIEELQGEPLDLVVNATSCGMKADDPFPVNPEILQRARLVYDVVYAKSGTKLVREAQRLGVPAAEGSGMLVNQAALSQALWFPDADRHSIRAIMKEALEAWPG